MFAYIALVIAGLFFLSGLVYLFRTLKSSYRNYEFDNDEDPLLETLVVQKARQEIRGPKAIGVLLCMVGISLLAWYLFLYEPAPINIISSTKLYQEFSTNELRANDRYRGKYIIVSGTFAGTKTVYGSPSILLETLDDYEKVQCNVKSSRAFEVETLELGKELSLRGLVLGKTDNIVLDKCAIVK